MALKIKTGQAVRGENEFFKRDDIVETFWDKIDSGSSILISAPRRVGKTSVMHFMEDNPPEGCNIVYTITESVNSESEYYEVLYNAVLKGILDKKDRFINKASTTIRELLGRFSSVGIDGTIAFDKEVKIDFRKEFANIIDGLNLDGEKLIIMVDEFAQAVENIKLNEGEGQAVHFLQTNRELRQLNSFRNKVQFVYAGSIGLENVVSRLDAINHINDLDTLEITPLSEKQGDRLIWELTESLKFFLGTEQREYILKKIQWLIPFYIQLVISELRDITKSDDINQITEELIDEAFERILRRRNFFEHWQRRLKKVFKQSEYKFTMELLNHASIKGEIDNNEIFNLAVKYCVEETSKDIVNMLVYDGYISKNKKEQVYRFNSPILRMWWCEYVAS